MTRQDQKILGTVIDLLEVSARADARHALVVRDHLRGVVALMGRFTLAQRNAERRGRELQRRDAAATDRRLKVEPIGNQSPTKRGGDRVEPLN